MAYRPQCAYHVSRWQLRIYFHSPALPYVTVQTRRQTCCPGVRMCFVLLDIDFRRWY
jgi:hypothetical protein